MIQLGEVLLRLLRCGRPETLVVLDVPPARAIHRRLPVVVLGQRVEYLALLALGGLDDGRDELHEEAGDLEQGREVRVQEVNQQSFDV